MGCTTCGSRRAYPLQKSNYTKIIFCFKCWSLFFISNILNELDHEPDFMASHYQEVLNKEGEEKNYCEILKMLSIYLETPNQNIAIHDFGCGPGDFMYFAKNQGFTVTGNDIWDEMIGIAKHKGLNVYLGPFDIEKHKNLSAITFLCVLAHMDEPWKSVSSASKSLSKQGIIYFHTPRFCAIDFVSIFLYFTSFTLYSRMLNRRVNQSHRRIYSKKGLKIELQNANLSTLSLKISRGYGLKYSQYFKSMGFSSKTSLKIEQALIKFRLEKALPRNRWSVYCNPNK